jgi:hypothetical protein
MDPVWTINPPPLFFIAFAADWAMKNFSCVETPVVIFLGDFAGIPLNY